MRRGSPASAHGDMSRSSIARTHRRKRRQRVVRGVAEHDLHVAQRPYREAGLAVGEVVRPDPQEALVVAERTNLLEVLEYVVMPLAKRAGIAEADLLDAVDLQPRPRDRPGDRLERGQKRAREDRLLDPVRPAAVALEPPVGHTDRLQAGEPLRCEQAVDGAEVVAVLGETDRLEHLDRGDLREATLGEPVILLPDLDPVLKAERFDAGAREARLARG